jgi:hypothetical protein
MQYLSDKVPKSISSFSSRVVQHLHGECQKAPVRLTLHTKEDVIAQRAAV